MDSLKTEFSTDVITIFWLWICPNCRYHIFCYCDTTGRYFLPNLYWPCVKKSVATCSQDMLIPPENWYHRLFFGVVLELNTQSYFFKNMNKVGFVLHVYHTVVFVFHHSVVKLSCFFFCFECPIVIFFLWLNVFLIFYRLCVF